MSGNINIQGTTPIDDPEYRYKMPQIMGKVEGRGNGIKTALPNMTLLAQSLHRDPAEVTKFFGAELGAQTTWNPETERAIVNGAHTTKDLQTNVFKYIEKFVLCPACRLPETVYKIKGDTIYHVCSACGAKEMVDMTHKLTVFILKQHKSSKKDSKKDKKDKKKKKGDDDDEDEDGGKDKKKKKKDKKEKKAKKEKKKKKEKKDADDDDDNDDDDDDDDEGVAAGGGDDDSNEASDDDNSDEAESPKSPKKDSKAAEDADIAASMDDMTIGMTAKESAIETMMTFLGTSPSPDAVITKVREIASEAKLMFKECAYILVASLFDNSVVSNGQVASNVPILQALVSTDANKFMARHLIGAFEDFFGIRIPELKKFFPLILKQLYDEDVLEEEVILDWASQGVTYEFSPQSMKPEDVKALRASAEPFITWLSEAEEDDDDDE